MQLEYLGATIVRLDEEEPATARAMIKCFSVSIAADDGQKQDGFGYLSLAPELLSALFERFFGGRGDISQGSPTEPVSTPPTRAEHYLFESIAQCLLPLWQEIWHPLPSMSLNLLDTMTTDETPSEGRLMRSRYRLRLSEEATGTFEINMPMSLLEHIAPGRHRHPAAHQHWHRRLTTTLSQTPVELRAILAEQTLPLQKIMGFRKGDIVPLPLQETVVVNAADQPVFTARVGIGSGHLALAFLDNLSAS